MQIRDKEAIKSLPAEDFIINLSKKEMLEIARKLDCRVSPSAAKMAIAQRLAQMYLFFPHQMAQLLDEPARQCLKTMLMNDCECGADVPGVGTLKRLGIAQVLTEGENSLAVVPRVYLKSAAAQ